MKREKIHFIGIAGSGMNPLARFLAIRGDYQVTGSDRLFDQGQGEQQRQLLEKQGIIIGVQDGSILDSQTTMVIASGAVEESVPEMVAARQFGIPVLTRPELLARLTNEARGIAVTGTSGKTTVTGMCGTLFTEAGLNPNIICGGLIRELGEKSETDSIFTGESDYFIFEADESDGSLVGYTPDTGLILNITKDHKPLAELEKQFETFIGQIRNLIVYNFDDPRVVHLVKKANQGCLTISFGFKQGADLQAKMLTENLSGSSFTVAGQTVHLSVPGRHNVSNALSCIAAGTGHGIPMDQCCLFMERFRGTRRRLEVIGTFGKGLVIDDFAHNPDKIAASLSSLLPHSERVIVFYQPHGFGPTKFLKDELIDSFVNGLRDHDILIMPEIYYAGGTVSRDISSDDIVSAVNRHQRQAVFIPERADCIAHIIEVARESDMVVIMGARDDSLTDMAREVFRGISIKFAYKDQE